MLERGSGMSGENPRAARVTHSASRFSCESPSHQQTALKRWSGGPASSPDGLRATSYKARSLAWRILVVAGNGTGCLLVDSIRDDQSWAPSKIPKSSAMDL